MKTITVLLFTTVVVTLFVAGCMSGQPPVTPGTVPSLSPSPQVTVNAPITTLPVSGNPPPTVMVPPATPASPYPVSPVPSPMYVGVPSPVVLEGTWYLQSILLQGAGSPLDVSQVRITATFDSQGEVTGNSGCNNYEGPYTVTGQVISSGSSIRIGPLSASVMSCPDTRETETMYQQILGSAVSYALFPGQRMSITDNQGNSLVFSSSPYFSQTSVPSY